jgi:hypothetical protein
MRQYLWQNDESLTENNFDRNSPASVLIYAFPREDYLSSFQDTKEKENNTDVEKCVPEEDKIRIAGRQISLSKDRPRDKNAAYTQEEQEQRADEPPNLVGDKQAIPLPTCFQYSAKKCRVRSGTKRHGLPPLPRKAVEKLDLKRHERGITQLRTPE